MLDTNVVLDVLLDRQPHARDAIQVFTAIEQGTVQGCLGATTLTTLHYLVAKEQGRKAALETIATLLKLFEVAPVTGAVLAAALDNPGRDYEDAVLVESARLAGADALITRNPRDFIKAPIPVHLPREALKLLEKN